MPPDCLDLKSCFQQILEKHAPWMEAEFLYMRMKFYRSLQAWLMMGISVRNSE